MGMPLTLGDLTLIVVLFVTVIAGFFLIRVLSHIGGILSTIKKTLKSNSENLNSIIGDIPKITEKVAEISKDAQVIVSALKEEQKVLDVAINDVGKLISAVSSTAQAINDDLLSKIKAVFNALAFLVNSIMKKSNDKGKESQGDEVNGDNESDVGASDGDKLESGKLQGDKLKSEIAKSGKAKSGKEKSGKEKSGKLKSVKEKSVREKRGKLKSGKEKRGKLETDKLETDKLEADK